MEEVEYVVMPSYGWTNQVPIKYIQFYPSGVDRIVVNGDHVFLDPVVTTYKHVVVWDDTPLVDCDFVRSDNIVFVPASEFVKEILENCEVKNVTEVIHKPLIVPQVSQYKKYDMVAVLTQPQRKGHEVLSRVLHKLDSELERDLTLLLRVHDDIRLFFTNFKHIKVIDLKKTPTYADFLNEVGKARVMLFPSHDEGIGYPPMEAVSLNQQLIMGDIDATREFVSVKSAGFVDAKLEELYYAKHYFLIQLYDEDEYLELLRKALGDAKCCRPELKSTDVTNWEGLYKRVFEIARKD